MITRLNYLWRLFGTALSFASFGIGALLLTFVILPVRLLACSTDEERKSLTRRIIHRTFRNFTHMMSFLGVIDFYLGETEVYLAGQGGKVVIANHPSLIDVVVLIAAMPQADCIIKEKLWDNIFIRGVVTAADYIKNNEDIDSLISSCDTSLKAGYSLIIFPEGTRTKPGNDIILQRGASNIALRCGVDLASVLIRCRPTTLTKNEPWYSIPSSKVRFNLQPGKIFHITDYLDDSQSIPVSARHLTEDIKIYFTESLNSHG